MAQNFKKGKGVPRVIFVVCFSFFHFFFGVTYNAPLREGKPRISDHI